MQTLAAAARLDELAAADTPYVLYFTAPWCRPCQQFGPVVEQVSDELAGQLTFVKVDVDDHADIAGQYDVTGIPALTVVQGERVLWSSVGAMSRSRLGRALRAVAGSH